MFSGAAVQLPGTDAPGNIGPFAWSPDGEVLLYGATDGLRIFRPKAASSGAPDKDALIMKASGGGATLISRASFSPDGKWIVYTVTPSDGPFVYVSSFPVGVGGQRKIMNGNANSPVWHRDEIFSISLEGVFQVLGIKTQPAPDWTNPTRLFTLQGLAAGAQGTTNYDITRDGKQILLVVPDVRSAEQAQEIQIVLNWDQELKRLVP